MFPFFYNFFSLGVCKYDLGCNRRRLQPGPGFCTSHRMGEQRTPIHWLTNDQRPPTTPPRTNLHPPSPKSSFFHPPPLRQKPPPKMVFTTEFACQFCAKIHGCKNSITQHLDAHLPEFRLSRPLPSLADQQYHPKDIIRAVRSLIFRGQPGEPRVRPPPVPGAALRNECSDWNLVVSLVSPFIRAVCASRADSY